MSTRFREFNVARGTGRWERPPRCSEKAIEISGEEEGESERAFCHGDSGVRTTAV